MAKCPVTRAQILTALLEGKFSREPWNYEDTGGAQSLERVFLWRVAEMIFVVAGFNSYRNDEFEFAVQVGCTPEEWVESERGGEYVLTLDELFTDPQKEPEWVE